MRVDEVSPSGAKENRQQGSRLGAHVAFIVINEPRKNIRQGSSPASSPPTAAVIAYHEASPRGGAWPLTL